MIVSDTAYTLGLETNGEPLHLQATALVVQVSGANRLMARFSTPIEIPPEVIDGHQLRLSQAQDFLDRIGLMEVAWQVGDFLQLQHNWAVNGQLGGEVRLHVQNILNGGWPVAEFSARGMANADIAGVSLEYAIALTVVFYDIPKLRFDLDDLNISFPDIDFPALDLTSPLPLTETIGAARIVERLLGGVTAEFTVPENTALVVKKDGEQLRWGFFSGDHPASFGVSINHGGTELAQITNLSVTGTGAQVNISGTVAAGDRIAIQNDHHQVSGLTISWKDAKVGLAAQSSPFQARASLTFERLVLQATADPSALVAVSGEIEMTASGHRIVSLRLIEPYPAELVAAGAQQLQRLASRILALRLRFPDADLSNMQRLLAVLGRIAAAAARAGGQALQGMAQTLGEMLESLLHLLDSAPQGLLIELRFATDPLALRQVLVSLSGDTPAAGVNLAGLRLDIPAGCHPGVLIDLAREPGAYLTVGQTTSGPLATLATDLWLKQGDRLSPMRDADPQNGGRPETPLVKITASAKTPKNKLIILAGIQRGEAVFLRKLTSVDAIPIDGVTQVTAGKDFAFAPLTAGDFDIELQIDSDRVLPLLGMGERGDAKDGTGFLERLQNSLSQTVWMKGCTSSYQTDRLQAVLKLGIRAAGVETEVDLALNITLRNLQASLELQGGGIALKSKRIEERARGLVWVIEPKNMGQQEAELFMLSFDGGETSLELNPSKARMEIRFTALSSDGRGVALQVNKFRISRAGLDLSATATGEPVRLNGIDVPFRFTTGSFEIRQGRLTQATIGGHGSLPRALVGDVDCALLLNFIQDQSTNEIVLQSAKVEFDKKGQPVVCEATRFTLTIDDLDIAFVREGGSYHLYFLLTGALEFTPREGEFAKGLLQFLGEIRIELERAPLAADPKVLLSHISFQKALNPKKTFSLFNLFEFELRGFGFHPASARFDGQPAMNISGQILFAEIGDVMRPEIDFHGLWIAAPAPGEALPRIKADGLGLGISLSGVARIRGNVLAVDPQTPSLEGAELAPPGYDAYGFLGEGELAIDGWGAMAASMGFLEVSPKDRPDERKKSFFLYAEQRRMAIKIPVGAWVFYMREVGFGFGYRYTLRGIKDAERAGSTAELVHILDEVSKRQGDLAKFGAWLPDPENDKVTLAMRAALQCNPASDNWNEKAEKSAQEPFFFDIVAALRSDMTFLMAARGWVATNYWDFHTDSDGHIREHPGFRGYLFLSAPRKEFLLRCIGDSRGYVGDRMDNLQTLKPTLKSVDWSMTLYIDPSVFHLELGWPNELVARLRDDPDFRLIVRGGMIFRAAEDGLLWGYNIEASAVIRFSGGLNAGALGITIEASLTVDFVARLIAFLSWRLSGSFLYGLIALHVGLQFKVRAWMTIDLGITSFTIDISFSHSVQFTASVELAISTSGLGAKVVAPVGIPAFGCTLCVTVSFIIGDNSELETARAQVARFLSLGIANPGAGDPGPAEAIRQADQQLLAGAARADKVADAQPLQQHQSETEAKPPIRRAHDGRGIEETDFWLVLHQAGSDPDQAYALLVPKEPKKNGTQGGFYCAPHGGQDLSSGNLLPRSAPKPVITCQLDVPAGINGIERWEAILPVDLDNGCFRSLTAGSCISVETRWDALVPTDKPTKPAFTMAHLFDECFLYDADWNAGTRTTIKWNEPPVLRHREACDAGTDRARADLQRDRQADAAANPVVTRVQEARSTVLAMFLDQFVTLARTGKRKDDKAHVTDLGLVFRGRVSELEKLQHMRMTKTDTLPTMVGTIEVLNKRAEWFDRADPLLAHTREPAVAKDGIRLDWRLQAFQTADRDPEQLLHHYEITAEIDGITRWREPRMVKPAMTLGGRDENEITTMRPEWQFTDDLADLTASQRRAILPSSGEEGVVQAARDWIESFGNKDVVLTYSVIPVDIAGTRGSKRSFILPIQPQLPIRPARAELRFLFGAPDGRHHGLQPPGRLTVILALDDAAWDTQTANIAGAQRSYRLILDPEDILPSGSFGSDGLTDRRQATISDGTPSSSGDEEVFEFIRGPGLQKSQMRSAAEIEPDPVARGSFAEWLCLAGPSPQASVTPLLDSAQQKRLFQILWRRSDGGRVAVRFALETRLTLQGRDRPLVSRRVSVDFEMRLADPAGTEGETVVLRPDAFEWPVRLDMPPLTTGEVRTESGFAMLRMPSDKKSLADLLTAGSLASQNSPADASPNCLIHLRDPQRRILTRIEWDALPGWASAALEGAPPAMQANAIAGYDLHELDIDDLAVLDSSSADNSATHRFAGNRSVWAQSRRVARVQLLPDGEARLVPDNNAELLAWDAHYPSETWRLDRSRTELAGNHRPIWRHWWSAAETASEFPDRIRRLRLLPVPDETLLAEMLRGGSPTTLLLRISGDTKPAFTIGLQDVLLLGEGTTACNLSAAQFGMKSPDVGEPREWTIARHDNAGFTPADLRALQFCLVAEQDDGPITPTGLTLHITGMKSCGMTGQSAIALDFSSPVHPVLQEMLADICHVAVPGANGTAPQIHRRYMPVLQPAPALAAADLDSFLSATAASKDPFGWGLLQSLGLSVTLRLHDPVRREFLSAQTVLQRIEPVLRAVLTRYRNTSENSNFGLPFAEILLRPGADRAHAGFDTPAHMETGSPLDWSDALAAVQISLRPSPEMVWHYLTISGTWKDPVAMTGAENRLGLRITAPADRTIELLRPLDGQQQLLQPGQTAILPIASMPRLATTRPDPQLTVLIRSRQLETDDAVGVEVVQQTGVGGVWQPLAGHIRHGAEPSVDGFSKVSAQRPGDAGWSGADPFGQFPVQPPEDWREVLFTEKRRLHGLGAWLDACLPDLKWPETDEAKKRFANQYPDWARRFLDNTASPQPKPDSIHFAFAAPNRTMPWKVAATADGRASVSFLHSDRWGHVRAYAVKPFGRYQEVMLAAGAYRDLSWDRNIARATLEGLLTGLELPDLPLGHAIAVSPRTEKIEPPVILDSRVLTDGTPRDGQWQVVLPRHNEEHLAASNLPLFARLGWQGLALSFVRQYRHDGWPQRLELGREAAIPHPALSPSPQQTPNQPGGIDAPQLGKLAGEFPSLWKGADIYSFAPLPHFYRASVLAVARAGIVVSPITLAVQEDFRASMPEHLPEKVIAPRMEVVREGDGTARLRVDLPLLSYADFMPEKVKDIWLPSGSAPNDIAYWPDPEAVYVIEHHAKAAAAELIEEEAELRLVADASEGQVDALIMRVRGARYAVVAETPPTATRINGQGVRARLEIKLNQPAGAVLKRAPVPGEMSENDQTDFNAGNPNYARILVRSDLDLDPIPAPDETANAFRARLEAIFAWLETEHGDAASNEAHVLLSGVAQQMREAILGLSPDATVDTLLHAAKLPRKVPMWWPRGDTLPEPPAGCSIQAVPDMPAVLVLLDLPTADEIKESALLRPILRDLSRSTLGGGRMMLRIVHPRGGAKRPVGTLETAIAWPAHLQEDQP